MKNRRINHLIQERHQWKSGRIIVLTNDPATQWLDEKTVALHVAYLLG